MTDVAPDRFATGRAMRMGGLRRHYQGSDALAGIPGQWSAFTTLLPFPGQQGDTTYGIMCGGNADGFEYMCAVEVDSFDTLPPGIGRLRIEPRHYAVFHHEGRVATIRQTWDAIYHWLEQGEHVSAHKPDFEVYGPDFDTKRMQGLVEIWVAVERHES
ncbi:MAG: GyrI-like domain-containing protein [Proteobacteria bacterium]|nr:GyrI-like domain-containing protein [Pseudomonadota bacterium]HQR03259.1 GyrI-like domain-containing protein [Rhodocyclaceae bacterium]